MSIGGTMANKKAIAKSIIKWSFYSVCALGLFFVIYAATIIANSPKIDPDNIYSYLNETSIIYDDSGNKVDSVYLDGGNRINMKYEDFPKDLINAVVAVEDKTFWSHHGFNILRMFGAIKESLFSENSIGGTSTITQQLARNVYLPDRKSERSLDRKISEAWYTVLLEHRLTKKQIIEAYLNTIYMGNNSYGMASASNSYFSKDPGELSLLECAALASIPRSPDAYALVRILDNRTIENDVPDLKKQNIIKSTANYTTVYNGDVSKDRRDLTLELMQEQGYITQDQKTAAKGQDLKRSIHLNYLSAQGYTSYFTDFVADEVIRGLIKKGYSEKSARKMLYSGGLRIYSTLDSSMQKQVASEFKKASNFPSVSYAGVHFDKAGNICNSKNQVMLYAKKNYITKNKEFVLRKNEFDKDEKGNLILRKGHRLAFIKDSNDGKETYTIQFHPIFTRNGGKLYSIENSVLLIPEKYKAITSDGDLLISSKYLKDHPGAVRLKNKKVIFTKEGYTLGQKIRQPQGAMVICDNRTGHIKAMVGGRGAHGKKLYNRAVSTRQPGSAIKPLSVYTTALTDGEKASAKNKPQKFKRYDKNDNLGRYGSYWTARSYINDAPLTFNGRIWPKNAYYGYKGYVTMRKSVEQSVNVTAVRVFQQLEKENVINTLKDFGVSTVIEKGRRNDNNAAALALGGMTKGISPLEMASAYTTFQNDGKHREYSCFTRVENSKGDIVLENEPSEKTVMSEGVAFIMSDILRTTVTNGIGRDAKIPGQVTAGKTGTTSDKLDAWFCGFTPDYSAALWLGNDIRLQLDEGSPAAARMWSHIMRKVNNGRSGSLQSQPGSVIRYIGEYFIRGTQRNVYIPIVPKKTDPKDKKKKKKSKNTGGGSIQVPIVNDM